MCRAVVEGKVEDLFCLGITGRHVKPYQSRSFYYQKGLEWNNFMAFAVPERRITELEAVYCSND
jgi:hypothetical protein